MLTRPGDWESARLNQSNKRGKIRRARRVNGSVRVLDNLLHSKVQLEPNCPVLRPLCEQQIVGLLRYVM